VTEVDDHALAHRLAEGARDLLLRLRDSGLTGEELGREGDRRAHVLLDSTLRQFRPDDMILSEEGEPVRTHAGRLWIIDPLDGTREYCAGRDDWAVHVALVDHGELTAGAVALASGRTHSTAEPAVLPAVDRTRTRVVISRSHRPPLADALARELDVELVPMGSAGVKAIEVSTGRADAYVHDGGQYQWDTAAPVAVARMVGAHTSRIDGSPVVHGGPDPRSPDLLICRPELAPTLLQALRRAAAGVR
jgi:3'(2'), 5'-bisphosphate nucleotidase